TRPASLFPPASYAHYWGCTWSSLLTCWLGFGQVGFAPCGAHPLGNTNPFHRIAPTPKVSGLPWHEQCLVRCRFWHGHRHTSSDWPGTAPHTDADADSPNRSGAI